MYFSNYQLGVRSRNKSSVVASSIFGKILGLAAKKAGCFFKALLFLTQMEVQKDSKCEFYIMDPLSFVAATAGQLMFVLLHNKIFVSALFL